MFTLMLTRVHLRSPKCPMLEPSSKRCAAGACSRSCSRACISARRSAPCSSLLPSAALRGHVHAHAHARAYPLAEVPHARAFNHFHFFGSFFPHRARVSAVQRPLSKCDRQPGRLLHRRFIHFKITNRLFVIAFVIHWERKFLGIPNSCPKDADKRKHTIHWLIDQREAGQAMHPPLSITHACRN
jgi:hypothetical protein